MFRQTFAQRAWDLKINYEAKAINHLGNSAEKAEARVALTLFARLFINYLFTLISLANKVV